ncbi:aminotransferase class V-fold PLP-dependent enzyme [soil metagenome]
MTNSAPTDLAYLDHASTAAHRPPAVARAVADYITDIGVTPGRGAHQLANAAGRIALQCRQQLAELMDLPGDIGRIAFTANATHALNTALWGAVRAGDRVVVTAYDQNAVLRQCAALARERGADIVLVGGDSAGELDEPALETALDGARLLVLNAASNVLGTVLDVRRLAARARHAGVLSLVDVAQLAGHVPFSVREWGVDMVAFTGHKGLLGPQGIGGLWVRDGVDIEPLLRGGTGGDSMQRDMPAAWPDHIEAGTQNAPGMAGLGAGVAAVQDEGVAAVHARIGGLKQRLWHGLRDVSGVRVLSPAAPDGVGIVTLETASMDASALATRLDREHGVLTRPGLHCAPEVHRMLGTDATGALRLSLGWSSTEADVERAVRAVAAVLG